jgi:hypothetical protein
MQYEIVAKQLTSLRDEAGAGHRIIFLEMPTSIESADRKKIGNGGEDKLAQSWWRVNRILRRYKLEESPCWLGDDFNERFRYAALALSHPVSADYRVGSVGSDSKAGLLRFNIVKESRSRQFDINLANQALVEHNRPPSVVS